MDEFMGDDELSEKELNEGLQLAADNLGRIFFPGITRRKISSKYTSHLVNYKDSVLVVPLNLCHLLMTDDSGCTCNLQEGTADSLMNLISMKLGNFWFGVHADKEVEVTSICLKNWNSFGLQMQRKGKFKTPLVLQVRKPEEFRRVGSVMSLTVEYKNPLIDVQEKSLFQVHTLQMQPRKLDYGHISIGIFTSERKALAFARGSHV